MDDEFFLHKQSAIWCHNSDKVWYLEWRWYRKIFYFEDKFSRAGQ